MAAHFRRCCQNAGSQPDAPAQTRPAHPCGVPGLRYLYVGFRNFPYRSRHPLAAASETDGNSKAWKRMYEQVSEGVRGPDLENATGVIFAQLFHRVGDCLFPVFAGPNVANELREIRDGASGQTSGE